MTFDKLREDFLLAGYDEQVYNAFVKQNEISDSFLEVIDSSSGTVLYGFLWGESVEGFPFWKSVYLKLLDINK